MAIGKDDVLGLRHLETSYGDAVKAVGEKQSDRTATLVWNKDGTRTVLVRSRGRFEELPLESEVDLR